MKIRTIISYVAVICLLASAGCAKDDGLALNELSFKQFEYWLQSYKKAHPEYKFTPIGGFNTLICLEETKGDESKPLGAVDGSFKYLRVEYVNTDLKGNYIDFTVDTLAKQLGVYNRAVYYGPVIIFRDKENVYAGLNNVLSSMNVGGTMKYVSPGWLNTFKYHDTEQEYIDKEKGVDMIGNIKVLERIHNIITWEVDSVIRYATRVYGVESSDSVKYGMYIKTIVPPESPTDTLIEGTSYRINYIGRLLNGQVFDTTIEDTAKKYCVYNATKTYSPVSVQYFKDGKSVTMGGTDGVAGSSVVEGFGTVISKMHLNEKLKGVFYSGLGYEYDGRSPSIPPFCPLEFEVEFVGE